MDVTLNDFNSLVAMLTQVSEGDRSTFLDSLGIDQTAMIIIADHPSHLTLLKRIIELLTLIPMEERYIVEEIARIANYKQTQQTYDHPSMMLDDEIDDFSFG